jgi:hypothetical protein
MTQLEKLDLAQQLVSENLLAEEGKSISINDRLTVVLEYHGQRLPYPILVLTNVEPFSQHYYWVVGGGNIEVDTKGTLNRAQLFDVFDYYSGFVDIESSISMEAAEASLRDDSLFERDDLLRVSVGEYDVRVVCINNRNSVIGKNAITDHIHIYEWIDPRLFKPFVLGIGKTNNQVTPCFNYDSEHCEFVLNPFRNSCIITIDLIHGKLV